MLHIKKLLNLLCNCFVAALETIGGLSIEFKIDPNKSIASIIRITFTIKQNILILAH